MSGGWWSTEAGGMDFWMAYRELEEGVGLMEEGVELVDHVLGEDAGGEGREGWGKGRDGRCTARWSSW